MNWVKNTLSKAVDNLDECVLFCDNLTAQTSDEFLKEVRQNKGIVWFGVPNGHIIGNPLTLDQEKLLNHILKENKISGSIMMKTSNSGLVMMTVNYPLKIAEF